jgi:hypothetical protein
MDLNDYYLDLKMQEPINYNGLTIFQPSFYDIKKYGLKKYNQIIQVYSLTLDGFDNIKEKPDNLFDIIISDQYLIHCLCESLRLLTEANEIYLCEDHKYIMINSDYINNDDKSFIINSSNFDDISWIILKINASKKVVIEKPPENMSERQKDIWNKLQEGRTREAKKNEVHIYDVLNVCEFGGDYHLPIETICSWSLWRIMNCYKIRVGWKDYDDGLQIALVSGDNKIISGENHWYKKLMIRE